MSEMVEWANKTNNSEEILDTHADCLVSNCSTCQIGKDYKECFLALCDNYRRIKGEELPTKDVNYRMFGVISKN